MGPCLIAGRLLIESKKHKLPKRCRQRPAQENLIALWGGGCRRAHQAGRPPLSFNSRAARGAK
jgi:hypothetical protein